MWIRQIVIHGFKSYAERTEIGEFDQQFNAITGLNGSGKSNILDSICFVLGISNLSQVRASNLQELVYKKGQGGVTKATVTITFDNTNKEQSPLGYESYDEITISRQVVIGGHNKYLINGSNAQPARVHDLFRSVQLNVNNPHFLIMQGRITKVLNMKPPEILSMIEEAAGTRMYESKRISAQKTIEKKASKLREINTVLNDDIMPTLNKLREERSLYLDYQKVLRELEHLGRMSVAQQYCEAQELQKKSTEKLSSMEQELTSIRDKIKECVEEKEQAMAAIAKLEEQQHKKAQKTPLAELEKKVDEAAKALAVTEVTFKNSKEQLAQEKKNLSSLQRSLAEDQALLATKEEELVAREEELKGFLEHKETAQQAVNSANRHYQALCSGVSDDDELQSASLAQQKIALENNIATAGTAIKQAEMRLKDAREQAAVKEKSCKESQKAYAKEQSTLKNLQKELATIEASMEKLNFKEDKKEELVSKRSELLSNIASLEQQVEQLEAKFPGVQFHYQTPKEGFDHSRVNGVVAKLIDMKDPKYATALEITAGGKLYHIVVDNEETAKELLKNGQLKRRYTFIPLNKITSSQIPAAVVGRAQSLVGRDHVRPALDTADYKPVLKPAMQFVFGSTLLCDQLKQAQQVAFDKDVLIRCVTLSGDMFDPVGTLTGGSRPRGPPMLIELLKLKDVSTQLNDCRNQLASLDNELKKINELAVRYQQLKAKWEGKNHEVQLTNTRLEESGHHRLLTEIQELHDLIDNQEKIMTEAQQKKDSCEEQLKDVQDKMNDTEGHRQREMKKAEQAMNKARKEAEKVTKDANKFQQQVNELRLEIADLKESIEAQKKQMASCEENCNKLATVLEQHKAEEKTAKGSLDQVRAQLEQQKAVLEEANKEIRELRQSCHGIDQAKNKLMLRSKDLDHQMNKHQHDTKEAARRVEVLANQHEWINSDKHLFGQPNTAYDFTSVDSRETAKKLSRLEEQKESLAKRVNMRAMTMLGRAEEKYNDLMKKKTIVENDKAKIEKLIVELDEKKNAALQGAYQQVNKDFGSIFSTLLPGTSAKLSPMEGHSVLDGLEVRVAFSGLWKESLTELSGGQRSLVALSLILSLLLFKPAPLYILDEVDAALDLSHTQNIGQMLKNHFKHSQFIVVSLKDGMFNNANVLFKTRLVDGKSTVTRFVNPKMAAAVTAAGDKKAGEKKHKTKTTASTKIAVN